MDFASVRIITADLDRLVAFYELVLSTPAARPAPVFAEFRISTGALAIGSTATVATLGEGAPLPGSNRSVILEFLVADALARGVDTLVTQGAVQSNHVRQTVAAAARYGLQCKILLEERYANADPDYRESGNVMLDRLLGGEIVARLPAGTNMQQAMDDLATGLREQGNKPYVVPSGGSNPVGALGYVACAQELIAQTSAMGLRVDALVHATGSAGTQAGLVTGLAASNSGIPVLGISVHAGKQDQARHDQHREPENQPLLLRGADGDPAVLRIARPDGDQVLLLREPVDRVQEHVAVAAGIEERIRREVGIADRDESRLRFRRRLAARGGRRRRRGILDRGRDGDGKRDRSARVAIFEIWLRLAARGERLQVGPAAHLFDEQRVQLVHRRVLEQPD